MTPILAHNEKAAATWGAGGLAYDRVSENILDAIDHLVARVAPRPGENCLDVATGTGWTARRIKRRGANVIGIDIGAGVIEAAKELAADIDFRVGDAEQLDFPDEAFDIVTSTFGVMFVARPEDAAREPQTRRSAGHSYLAASRHRRGPVQGHAAVYAAATRLTAAVTLRVG